MVRLRRVRIDAPGWSRRRAGRGFVYLDLDRAPDRRRGAPRADHDARHPARVARRVDQPVAERAHPGGRARRRRAPAVPVPPAVDAAPRPPQARPRARRRPPAARRAPPRPRATSRSTACRARRCSPSRSGCSTSRTCGWAARGTRSSTARTVWPPCCARTSASWRPRATATPAGCTCTSPPSPARSATRSSRTTTSPTLVRTLTRRRDDGPELLAWRDDDGGWHDVTSADVGAYVKQQLGDDATPKDFRTWHATVLAARGLADVGAAARRPSAPAAACVTAGGARRRRGAREHARRVPGVVHRPAGHRPVGARARPSGRRARRPSPSRQTLALLARLRIGRDRVRAGPAHRRLRQMATAPDDLLPAPVADTLVGLVPGLGPDGRPRADAPLVAVTGVTGYVGGRLVPELLAAGYRVRAIARHPDRLRGRPWYDDVEVAAADAAEPDADPGGARRRRRRLLPDPLARLRPQLRVDRPAHRARRSRRRPARPASGGSSTSAGCTPRARTCPRTWRRAPRSGEILLACGVPTTVLRAAVILGSGSASFEMMRYLTERLPAMTVPRWVDNRIQPIAIRDVLRYLVGSAAMPPDVSRGFDIGGPDVLTYRDMMQRYAQAAGLPPTRSSSGSACSRRGCRASGSSLVTPVPSGLARPLVESLVHEVVCDEHDIAAYVPDPPGGLIGFDRAVRLALQRVQDAARHHAVVVGGRARRAERPAAERPGLGRRLALRRRAPDHGRRLARGAVAGASRPSAASAAGTRGRSRGGSAGSPTGSSAARACAAAGATRGCCVVDDAVDFWRVEAIERGPAAAPARRDAGARPGVARAARRAGDGDGARRTADRVRAARPVPPEGAARAALLVVGVPVPRRRVRRHAAQHRPGRRDARSGRARIDRVSAADGWRPAPRRTAPTPRALAASMRRGAPGRGVDQHERRQRARVRDALAGRARPRPAPRSRRRGSRRRGARSTSRRSPGSAR